jgi:hypothetical protein
MCYCLPLCLQSFSKWVDTIQEHVTLCPSNYLSCVSVTVLLTETSQRGRGAGIVIGTWLQHRVWL